MLQCDPCVFRTLTSTALSERTKNWLSTHKHTGRFSHGEGAVDWLHSVGPFMRKHVQVVVLGVAYLWHSLCYCTLIIR